MDSFSESKKLITLVISGKIELSGMKYLLVLFFAIVYEIYASCPNGTAPSGRCYFIPKDSNQSSSAETSCQDQNGNLASISDYYDNKYLKGKNYEWISLRAGCRNIRAANSDA